MRKIYAKLKYVLHVDSGQEWQDPKRVRPDMCDSGIRRWFTLPMDPAPKEILVILKSNETKSSVPVSIRKCTCGCSMVILRLGGCTNKNPYDQISIDTDDLKDLGMTMSSELHMEIEY